MASPKRRRRREQRHDDDDGPRDSDRPYRAWTDYELTTMLALISRGVHLDDSGTASTHNVVPLAARLNEALNPHGAREDDIDADDVRDMLVRLAREKKGCLAFIERQPRPPGRLTRLQRLVFQKRLAHDGSKREWAVEGRGRAERRAQAASYWRWLERVQRVQREKAAARRMGVAGVEKQGVTAEELPMTVYEKGALVRSLIRNGEAQVNPGDDVLQYPSQQDGTMTQSAWQMGPNVANGRGNGASAHRGQSQYPPATAYGTSYDVDWPGGQSGSARAARGGGGGFRNLTQHNHLPTQARDPFTKSLSYGPPGGDGGGGSVGPSGLHAGSSGFRTHHEHPRVPPFGTSPVGWDRDTPFSPSATPCSPAGAYMPAERLPSIETVLSGRAWTPTGEWTHPARDTAMSPGYGQVPQGPTGVGYPPSRAWEGGFSNMTPHRMATSPAYGAPEVSSGAGSPHYRHDGSGQGPWNNRPTPESTEDVWSNNTGTCAPAPAVAQRDAGGPRAHDKAAMRS